MKEDSEWSPKEEDVPEADHVTACFGEEKFSPIQYQSFAVGPFFASTKLRPGESLEQALGRAYAACCVAARHCYKEKRDEFIANVAAADQAARDAAQRRR